MTLADIEAEKKLLSALMCEDGAAIPSVIGELKPDDFYRSEHKKIYAAILRAYSEDTPLNPFVVENELKKSNDLRHVTEAYFIGLAETEFSTVRVNYYVKLIKEQSRLRTLREVGRTMLEAVENGQHNSTELLAMAEEKLTAVSCKQLSGTAAAQEIAFQTLAEISKLDGGLVGLKTCFYDLDKLTGGLKKSDLIILAARPSMGKTALAMNIAAHVARRKSVLVFSLEMSRSKLMQRLLSSEARVNAGKLQCGDLNDWERRAIQDAAKIIGARNLFINDTGGLSLLALKAEARRIKREHGLDLIVVDYIQFMQASKEYRGNRVQEVSELSRGLKALAKELDVPVLALSQLSRAVEQRAGKRPVLSDLRESGSIEQDADIVMFIYRDDYYNQDDAPNIAELIVAKNRNGATGTVRVLFDKDTVTFRNLAKEDNQ